MIDSPYIRIDKSLISQSNLKKLVSKVDLTKESINHETGNKSIYGNYKNFKIAVNNKSVCVNGSLPKFVLGNNVESLSVSETSTALIELSNELSIPILKGDLTRIDIAESFPVDANPE